MKVIQLGNGGGLSSKTNSSFVIEFSNGESILVDCGRNVFDALKKKGDNFIGKLNKIFITHMHDNHIGSLQTLIYYRYFKLGKQTKILAGYKILKNLEQYLEMVNINYSLIGSKLEIDIKVTFEVIENYLKIVDKNERGEWLVGAFETNHVVCPNYGYCFIDSASKKMVAITGDTKASAMIERNIKKFAKAEKIKKENITVYHDFSNWNVPSRNIHACESDFEAEYSDEFKELVVKYHYE